MRIMDMHNATAVEMLKYLHNSCPDYDVHTEPKFKVSSVASFIARHLWHMRYNFTDQEFFEGAEPRSDINAVRDTLFGVQIEADMDIVDFMDNFGTNEAMMFFGIVSIADWVDDDYVTTITLGIRCVDNSEIQVTQIMDEHSKELRVKFDTYDVVIRSYQHKEPKA